MTEIDRELEKALQQNGKLAGVLRDSNLPRRFQAMVLGLSTLKQMNDRQKGRLRD